MKFFNLKDFYKKSSLLFLENILSFFLGFLGTIIVARYLGPSNFGILSFCLGLFAIASIGSHMGLQDLATKEILINKSDMKQTMGTIFFVKLAGSIVSLILLLIYATISTNVDSSKFIIILILSFCLLLNPFNVFISWMQAEVLTKYIFFTKFLSNFIAFLSRISFVLLSLSLVYFGFISFISLLILALFGFLFFYKTTKINLFDLDFNYQKYRDIISNSFLSLISTFFAVILLKIDIIMINHFLGDYSTGLYSAASRITEAIYFIPNILLIPLFPVLTDLLKKNYQDFARLQQQIYDGLFLLSFFLFLVIFVLSDHIIYLLYGESFSLASSVLKVHSISIILVYVRAAFRRWVFLKDILKINLITQIIGCGLNIILNLYLIPNMGLIGAAYSTVLSYFISSFLIFYFFKSTREAFFQILYAFLIFIRVPYKIIRKKF